MEHFISNECGSCINFSVCKLLRMTHKTQTSVQGVPVQSMQEEIFFKVPKLSLNQNYQADTLFDLKKEEENKKKKKAKTLYIINDINRLQKHLSRKNSSCLSVTTTYKPASDTYRDCKVSTTLCLRGCSGEHSTLSTPHMKVHNLVISLGSEDHVFNTCAFQTTPPTSGHGKERRLSSINVDCLVD
ncbi:hypothetical protein STEG23_033942 [Scotinomys teguina]